MRWLFFLIMIQFLASCASLPPRNKQNACLLLKEKSAWHPSLHKASKRWGIPKHTILSVIYHESKFVADAKPPHKKFLGFKVIGRRISSAYGYPQALDGTWEEYKRKRGKRFASRTNFDDSADFIGWYLNRAVKIAGVSPRNAYELYLSYHQGINGFRRGSYHRKPSIKRYARKVQKTAVLYKKQLRSCSYPYNS